MIKNILLITATALVCISGFVIYERMTAKHHEEVEASVLLERVDKVFKLVTVEGNFSEIYTYRDHLIADIWPLRKKAIVQVVARVSIGYDLDDVKITTDEATRTIHIEGPLMPEILSLDHDIKNYDFENGLFNMISDQDITKMGSEVKEMIAEKALQSDLYQEAEAQKEELITMLRWMLGAAGWQLELSPGPIID